MLTTNASNNCPDDEALKQGVFHEQGNSENLRIQSWHHLHSFASKSDFDNFISSQTNLCQSFSKSNTIYFYCKFKHRYGCEYCLRYYQNDEEEEMNHEIIVEAFGEHCHQTQRQLEEKKAIGLPQIIKEELLNILELSPMVKPKEIWQKITTDCPEWASIVKIAQVQSYVTRYRKMAISKFNIKDKYDGNLSTSDDGNDLFILTNKEGEIDVNQVCIVFSTKNLLDNAKKSTFKKGTVMTCEMMERVKWNHHDLHVLGIFDVMQSFHPVAFCFIGENNKMNFYKEFFMTIKRYLMSIGFDWMVSVALYHYHHLIDHEMMSECKEIWPDVQLIVTFSSIIKYLKSLRKMSNNKNSISSIERDLVLLMDFPDLETFNFGKNLFMNKWHQVEPGLMEEFGKVVLEVDWGQAQAGIGIPCDTQGHMKHFTNEFNSFSRYNNTMKIEEVFETLHNWLQILSKNHLLNFPMSPTDFSENTYINQDYKKIINTYIERAQLIPMATEIVTQQQQQNNEGEKIMKSEMPSNYLCIPSQYVMEKGEKYLVEQREKFFGDWQNYEFDELVELRRSFFIVTGEMCTCSRYLRRMICEHVIGCKMFYKMHSNNEPEEMRNVIENDNLIDNIKTTDTCCND